MTLILRNTPPELRGNSYWSHNSSGEHIEKHYGEVSEINDLRRSRGKTPFNQNDLTGWMEGAGVVAVHTTYEDGGVGPTIGYVVSERNVREGVITVKDFYVKKAHRHKGVGGFLLGTLVTEMVQWDIPGKGVIRANYGMVLSLNGCEYKLPGMMLEVYKDVAGQDVVNDTRNRVVANIWSGILEVRDDGLYDATVYDAGEVVAQIYELERDDDDGPVMYQFNDHPGLYQSAAYAAIAALNQGEPGIY